MFTPEQVPAEPEYAIAVRGLTKRYGSRRAIDQLSLRVRWGEICGLAGANGGGKSTALRLLAGLMKLDDGEGTVLGCDLVRDSRAFRHLVGYLPQRSMLYATLSVRENLRFRAAVFGLPNPAAAADTQIRKSGLSEFAAVPAGHLSGGWMKQVELAAVLIHRPRLLLLDEPTVGLDPAARHAIWRTLTALADRGTAIVLSTHDLVEAQRCSNILLLSRGRTRALGSPATVTRQVAASALMVSGGDSNDLGELLHKTGVMAVEPVGHQVRFVVTTDCLEDLQALLVARGCTCIAVNLTLEDAALVVAGRLCA